MSLNNELTAVEESVSFLVKSIEFENKNSLDRISRINNINKNLKALRDSLKEDLEAISERR